MVQSNVMFVIHLSVLSNLPPKVGKKRQGGYCKLQEAVCLCLRSSYHSFMSAVVRLAHRRTRCRLTGPKSTHHLKSHKDRRSWPRSLDAFSHLSGGLHTYVFRQFRPNLSPGWPRTRFCRDLPLTVIWLGRSSHIHHFPLLFTKRIGNIVVFPALCKPRYAGISQNISEFHLPVGVQMWCA